MGKSYGVSICKEALVELSSKKLLSERVSSALAELNVMKYENEPYPDVSQQHSESLKELHEQGLLVDKSNEAALSELSRKIVYLCTDIIEANATDISESN